jgi:hypothetical protein
VLTSDSVVPGTLSLEVPSSECRESSDDNKSITNHYQKTTRLTWRTAEVAEHTKLTLDQSYAYIQTPSTFFATPRRGLTSNLRLARLTDHAAVSSRLSPNIQEFSSRKFLRVRRPKGLPSLSGSLSQSLQKNLPNTAPLFSFSYRLYVSLIIALSPAKMSFRPCPSSTQSTLTSWIRKFGAPKIDSRPYRNILALFGKRVRRALIPNLH